MSEVVLYRKYRSGTFEEVIGQEHVVTTLKNAVKAGSVGHAYLFSGPRGVGKTSVARILARVVNCKNLADGVNPCNQCESCRSFLEQSSLDLVEIDAASHRGIDNIRSLQEGVGFVPTESQKKVFIIDEVHMLTKEAFNALLKTLEEPPDHAIFVLATTELQKVPDTIISRCQHFNFMRVKRGEISSHMVRVAASENKKLSQEAATIIADAVGGSVRDGLSVLEQLLLVEDEQIMPADVMRVLGLPSSSVIAGMLVKLLTGDISGTFSDYYQQVYDRGVDINRFMSAWQMFLRQALLVKNGVAVEAGEVMESVSACNAEMLVKIMDILEDVMQKRYEIDSLYFEMFVNRVVIECRINVVTGNPVHKSAVKDERKESTAGPEIEAQEQRSIDKVNEKKGIKETKDVQQKSKLNESDIRKKWKEYVEAVSISKPVLGSMLKMAYFRKVEAGNVLIDVPFSFHKEKLDDAVNRELLFTLFEKIMCVKANLLIVVNERNTDVKERKLKVEDDMKKKVDESTGNSLVKDVIEVFGGEVTS